MSRNIPDNINVIDIDEFEPMEYSLEDKNDELVEISRYVIWRKRIERLRDVDKQFYVGEEI